MTSQAGPGPGAGDLGTFDLLGPLPGPGFTVLEASAGTGKTFTIANLVTRFVAEGVPLDQVLVVTFTRMATGELRQRTREALVAAEQGLRRVMELGESLPPGEGDGLLSLLAAPPFPGTEGEEVVRERHRRLAHAVANFDAATITTTHGFCHMVLEALGVWGGVAPRPVLVEDPTEVVEQVVDDLYIRRAVMHGPPPFSRRDALTAGRRAVDNPWAPLSPAATRTDASAAGLRRRLAEGVRAEVDARLLSANAMTYDGLLVRLAQALAEPGRGAVACARLSERYRVVLVDEFQDTDLVQWEVVRRAFGDGPARLVLIGDPKQAVYAFRGADVYAYLEAAKAAPSGQSFTLNENWRSDESLVRALDALLAPVRLGHPSIVYHRPTTPAAHKGSALAGAPVVAPLRVRLLPRGAPGLAPIKGGLAQKDSAVAAVARDLALDVRALLGSGATLLSRRRSGPGAEQLLGPRDIGVLVRTHRQAATVQAALRQAGVPVVVSGAQSVLSTPSARDWLHLLQALEQPASRSLAVAAALTDFVGTTAAELAGSDELAWESLHARLHEWSALVRAAGVATLFAHISATQGLPGRLLAYSDGERRLTDLSHIAELLHAQATGSQLGLAALRTWLARRCGEEAPEGGDAEQRARRLDSGDAAVQVLTVHGAKGLEFPVVYLPYVWDGATRDPSGAPVIYHDDQDGYRRKLDVGGEDGPVYRAHTRLALDERRGEDLRHLYVALTRARHQVVTWWAPAKDNQHSALGRLLLARKADGEVAPDGPPREPTDQAVRAAFGSVAARAPGLVSVEVALPAGAAAYAAADAAAERSATAGMAQRGPVAAVGDLVAAAFERSVDLSWRRTSYTGITVAAHAARGAQPLVGSEPEGERVTDEAAEALAEPTQDGAPSLGAPSPWSAVPGGPEVGTFVHAVLEDLDFAAPDLPAAVEVAVDARAGRYPGSPGELPSVVEGLVRAVRTPLGGPLGAMALRDLQRPDRVDEMRFELPLAGGDRPAGQVDLGALEALLRRHIPAAGPLAAYPDAFAALVRASAGGQGPARLRGYLTGSLDLVLRVGTGTTASYFVADYKSNRLGPPGGPLTAWHYRGEALAREMVASHYPLQALFYLVALHRYLRWRVTGYEPERHLGGAAYLFLRGMSGPPEPATPVSGAPAGASLATGATGIFWWQPPVALVTAASDWLAGSAPRHEVPE